MVMPLHGSPYGWATRLLVVACVGRGNGGGGAHALMYDIVDANKLPPTECQHGCARWEHLVEDGATLPLMQTNWLASRFTDSKMFVPECPLPFGHLTLSLRLLIDRTSHSTVGAVVRVYRMLLGD